MKIFDDSGGGGFISDIVSAMNLVKQRHTSNPNAKSVVSMSLAGYCGSSCSGNPLTDAISTMHDLGILFAVAASNDYNANACLYFPAAAPKAVAVAASDEFDNFASYSNTGPCVDIIAPGSMINSAQTGTSSYVKYSGTSMATPHVAGTLALLLEKKMVSFTTAPDNVVAALLCDAVKNKIQNIIPRTFGTTVNLLLQVPKNDSSFGCAVGTLGPGGCYSAASGDTCNQGLICNPFSAVAVCVGTFRSDFQKLNPNQCIYSPNYQYRLCFQMDARLVGYDSSNSLFYANNPYNYSPGYCMIEATGNFACFDKNNVAKFSTGTAGKGTAPYRLVLQNDRNIVLYDSNNIALWNSNTVKRLVAGKR